MNIKDMNAVKAEFHRAYVLEQVWLNLSLPETEEGEAEAMEAWHEQREAYKSLCELCTPSRANLNAYQMMRDAERYGDDFVMNMPLEKFLERYEKMIEE